MSMTNIYDAQEHMGESLLETQRMWDLTAEMESNEADYWRLANWMAKKQFVLVNQMRRGDNQTKREAQAYCKYVQMRMIKADLTDDDGSGTLQQGYEIYSLVVSFWLLLDAIINTEV